MARERLIIAIDGPAGAGKSSVAQAIARRFGYVNLDTGAMYRALGLKALRNGISPDDATSLAALADRTVIDLEPQSEGNRVLLDGEDVSGLIRTQEVSDAASRCSVHPRVREWMVARQREMGLSGGVVMEGRDIGTKVFPDADLKVFLDASPEIRAERRLLQKGGSMDDLKKVAEEIRARDERDRGRSASPLEPAPDAVTLDSSSLTLEQVVDAIEKMALETLAS